MDASTHSNRAEGRGLAFLFDDGERKVLFRKYLIFLGWLELAIFVMCWFYQLGTDGYDRFGPIEIPFPWKTYFLLAFLTPVAVTFLIGLIIVGFNQYLGSKESASAPYGPAGAGLSGAAAPGGRIERAAGLVRRLERLPYLALLLLLGAAIGFVYHLDTVMGFVGAIGERTIKAVLIGAAALLAVLSILAFTLLVMNYRLRKRAMDYRYRTQVAERFGLVILDDNTVLNHTGQLLIRGRNWKDSVPLLTAETGLENPAVTEPIGPDVKPNPTGPA